MENKEAYRKKIEAQLDEWIAEADKLRAKFKKKKAETEIDYSNYLDDLKEKQKNARSKLKKLEEAGEGAWKELKAGIEKAKIDLKKSFENAKEKLN